MSSICNEDLIQVLKRYPPDTEVVMEIRTKYESPPGTSIAYINGIRYEEDVNEVRLMN